MLSGIGAKRHRSAEGRVGRDLDPVARDQSKPIQVTQELRVAIGHVGNQARFARLERADRPIATAGREPQLRIGDRVAMGVVRRVTERRVDAFLDLLGEGVFEPVGFFMNLVERHPERLSEVLLEQSMVADDLERDTAPLIGQRHAAIRDVLQQLESRKSLQHRARRGCADLHRLGHTGRRGSGAGGLELVDLA